MQATQSSNADGKRAFPSPFTAPIQAARRLMESQRQDAHGPDSDSDTAPEDLSETGTVRGEEPPAGLTGAWRGQIRYDEAAIVASLDAGLECAEAAGFDDGLDPVRDFAMVDHDSGTADPPFGKPPFVSLGLDFRGNRGPDLRWDRGPDPDAVRAAISRLARDSQGRELQSKQAALSRDATATAAEGAAAFADVARRVWGEVAVETAALHPVEDAGEKVDGSGGAGESAISSPTREISAGAESDVTSGVASANAAVSGNPARSIGTGIADMLSAPIQSRAAEPAESKEASVSSVLDGTVPASAAGSSEEGECLAHDAGNLLSAMRLYSELLCLSGVLQERHRHYAEDLKLLATRSQRLIDRLLKLGERLADGRPKGHMDDDAKERPRTKTCGQILDLHADGHEGAQIQAAPWNLGAPQSVFDVLGSGEVTGIGAAADPLADPRLEGTNVAAALERMGNLLRTMSHGALRIDIGPDSALPVAIGLEPLERILVNLVSNATAALRTGGGAIRVRVLAQTGSERGQFDPDQARTLVLTVDDSGCGMSAKQIREALGEWDEESLTVQDSSARRGRRGLGLRIVRELVASSGGRLFIHSQPGTGTRIEIHWPTLTRPSLRQQAGPATFSVGPLPAPEGFDPAVPRKPAGVVGTGVSTTSVRSNSVSRIRAGAVAGDEGAVAC